MRQWVYVHAPRTDILIPFPPRYYESETFFPLRRHGCTDHRHTER